MATRKTRLDLEGLTERVVPAVSAISFYNGSLSVRLNNQGGTLTMLGQANNFRLQFNGTAIGNLSGYNVTNNINITGGNGVDAVSFEPRTAGTPYRVPANLTMSLGNGNDTLDTKGDFSVNGSAIINMGNGNDAVAFSSDIDTDTTVVNGSMTLNMLAGNDTLTADTGALTVNGFTTVNGGNTVNLTAAGATTVEAGVSVLLNSLTVNSNYAETFSNTLSLGAETQLRGNLVYISGAFTDSASIDGSTILGNATLNLGQGGSAAANQTVTFSATTAATVNGNLTLIAGNGVDAIEFSSAADTTVTGSVSMTLGNGDNTITLDGTGGSLIGGGLTIRTGTGDDSVAIGSAGNLFSINGSVSVTLGNATNGNDLTLVSTAIGGNLAYVGGSGDDTVTFTSNATANVVAGRVSANMGGGGDTFAIDPAATAGAGTTAFGTLYLDYGVGSGPDVFTNNSGIDFDISIFNFVG